MAKECKSGSNESCLADLKNNYSILSKKYSLPSFEELNQEFQIEKLAEIETDYLLREIRKFITEKFSNYLNFIETLLNPASAHMFVFTVIKTLENKDKENLSELYKKLSRKEVETIRLDLDFSEKSEAEFIKNSFEFWKNIKDGLLEIVAVIEKNWDVKVEKVGKGYFG